MSALVSYVNNLFDNWKSMENGTAAKTLMWEFYQAECRACRLQLEKLAEMELNLKYANDDNGYEGESESGSARSSMEGFEGRFRTGRGRNSSESFQASQFTTPAIIIWPESQIEKKPRDDVSMMMGPVAGSDDGDSDGNGDSDYNSESGDDSEDDEEERLFQESRMRLSVRKDVVDSDIEEAEDDKEAYPSRDDWVDDEEAEAHQNAFFGKLPTGAKRDDLTNAGTAALN